MSLAYRFYAYFGLASVFGFLLYGFRFDPNASPWNVVFNVGLYLAFGVPHLLATRAWFKQAVWGAPAGTPVERRVYVGISIALWIAVIILHKPIPGPYVLVPEWIRFVGMLGLVLSIMMFFQGLTFEAVDGLMAAPGAPMSHSHGAETPLLTDGAYARVRHPMYQAAVLGGLCSIVIHGNAAAALWAGLIGVTFVGFIPIEERQLIAARGDTYRDYMKQTPYRLFRGVW